MGGIGTCVVYSLAQTAFAEESMADGSLVPSWILHSAANLFATALVMFASG